MRKRPSARLIVLNPDNCVLLFHFVFNEGALAGEAFWATPGGALHPGESYQDAARRELLEETGIQAEVGEEVAQRDAVFWMNDGEQVTADERFFLIRAADSRVIVDGQEALEASVMKAFRWWSVWDLRETSERVYPENIAQLVERLM